MGLVEEKVKLQQLESQLQSKKTTLVRMKEDCAYCKSKGTGMFVPPAPNGMKCTSAAMNNYTGTCATTQQGGIGRINRDITTLERKIAAQELVVLAEETKNDVYLKEQELLQQTFETDTGEQEAAQALAKAQQELEKLKLEAARASAASRLADKGNMEGARALLGVQEAEGSWKKPVIISGIVILAVGVGFGIWKLVK